MQHAPGITPIIQINPIPIYYDLFNTPSTCGGEFHFFAFYAKKLT
jgi:hypothetical protein